MSYGLHVDGGSRGNPGPAAAGVVLHRDNQALLEAGYLLGELTNNQAEYSALILGLQAAQRCNPDQLTIYSDSELMVKQIKGQYKVSSVDLKVLLADARRILDTIPKWTINHIRREHNSRADELVNQAMDENDDVVAVDRVESTPRLTPQRTQTALPSTTSGVATSHPIQVQVMSAPDPSCCRALCRVGQEYIFHDTVPDSLCLYAAQAILPVIIELREKEASTSPNEILHCRHSGCRATFAISPVRNRS